MLTHKKKLFRNITLFALALSLVQTCWAGFLSEKTEAPLPSNYAEQALQEGEGVKLSLANDSTELALKQLLNSDVKDAKSYAPSVLTTVKLDTSSKITDSDKRISLSLRESDVCQVLRMIADKAGMNIVFHSSVEGFVTLDLNNVTLNDAFQLVLKSMELTYVKDGNSLIVAKMEDAKELGLGKDTLTIIPVKYVEAPSVAKFLNENIFSAKMAGISNKHVAASNPRTNEVLIFGTEADADVARKVVEQVDKKPALNVFKIKHTTPKEMAALLCDTLIPSQDTLNNPGQQAQSTETQIDDGDTESAAEESTNKAVKLGGGFVACRAAVADSSGQGVGQAQDDSTKVYSLITPPLTVTFSPDLAQISVYGGSESQIEMIRDFIESNDIQQPMAYIELAVIELNEEGSKEFNNDWAMWTPFLSMGFSKEGISTAQPIVFGPDTVNGRKYSGRSVLTYKLQYLVKNNKGRILTNPKLMVTNGQKSIIDLTSDYIKKTSTEVSQETQTTTPIVTRTYEIGSDEGLSIQIIPFISQEGYVSMNITPNFSSVKQQMKSTDANGNEIIDATMLQRRNLKLSNLRIKDGETLVIAGLIKEDEKQEVVKVPVLGDLPLIGVFFRNSSKSLKKEELVIMITPHIVYSEDQIREIKTLDL